MGRSDNRVDPDERVEKMAQEPSRKHHGAAGHPGAVRLPTHRRVTLMISRTGVWGPLLWPMPRTAMSRR